MLHPLYIKGPIIIGASPTLIMTTSHVGGMFVASISYLGLLVVKIQDTKKSDELGFEPES